MAIIKNIKTYNAPMEINSADRFVENVDTKLAKYLIKSFDEATLRDFISYQIKTSVDMEITIRGKRASYIRVEGDLFDDISVSYWFITGVIDIESETSTRYNCKLDVFATYGKEIFDRLATNKIKISRAHEDRYTYDNTLKLFELNKETHSMINTDFKLRNTTGVEIVYDGNGDSEQETPLELKPSYIVENELDSSGNYNAVQHSSKTIYMDNRIITPEGKIYYLYAILNTLGEPKVVSNTNPLVISNFQVFPDIYDLNHTTQFHKFIVPINTLVDKVDFLGVEHNTINIINELQEGKVINIIKSPFKIDAFKGTVDGTATQILYEPDSGERLYRKFENNAPSSELYDVKGVKVNLNNISLGGYEVSNSKTTYYSIIGFAYNLTNRDHLISINTSKLTAKAIMDKIVYTATQNEMRDVVNVFPEYLEIGMLHPQISPITIEMYPNASTTLDTYNFYKNGGVFKGWYILNEQGFECKVKLSENQYLGWSENDLISFQTDQGATYLARHKYTMDAQKTGIELQTKLSEEQVTTSQMGHFGGGIAGGILSMLNPTNWSALGEEAAQKSTLDKIASNKKDQIQASINDAYATAPQVTSGSQHNLRNLLGVEKRFKFNWWMKYPNKFISQKIIRFYDRHGYLINDWVDFNNSVWKSRSRFNYLEIDEFKDYIATFNNFDINMLNLIDSELKKGIRIWHIDDINYNHFNIESIITNNI